MKECIDSTLFLLCTESGKTRFRSILKEFPKSLGGFRALRAGWLLESAADESEDRRTDKRDERIGPTRKTFPSQMFCRTVMFTQTFNVAGLPGWQFGEEFH